MADDFLAAEAKMDFADDVDLMSWLSVRNTLFRDYESRKAIIDSSYSHHSNYELLASIVIAIRYIPDAIRLLFRSLKVKNFVIITGCNTLANNNQLDAFLHYLDSLNTNYISISFGKEKLNADYSFYSVIFFANLLAGAVSVVVPRSLFSSLISLVTKFENNFDEHCLVPRRYLYRKNLSSRIVSSLFMKWMGKRILRSVFFIEEGHYQDKSYLVRSLKKNEIVVIEQQHGMVHLNHDAYNYPLSLHATFAPFLPDEFLVYEEYWARMIRIPGSPIVIGWYKLGGHISRKVTEKEATVCLIIGTGLNTEDTIAKFITLQQRIPSVNFIFRPHPSERNYVENLVCKTNLDTRPLFDSLSRVNCVLGEVSTVLFEAKILGCAVLGIKSNYLNNTGLDGVLEFVDFDEETISNFLLQNMM